MGTLWQALPPLKTVPVQNAQFVNIGVIKSGDIFNYKSSDAVNAFGTIERFGAGIILFDKRYFTTTNWVKITVVNEKPLPKKPTPKPKTPPLSTTAGGVGLGFFGQIWLNIILMISRFFQVISWIVTKAITAVVKSVEFIAKAILDGLQKSSKLGFWFYAVVLLAFFLLFPSTFFALIRALGQFLSKLVGGNRSK